MRANNRLQRMAAPPLSWVVGPFTKPPMQTSTEDQIRNAEERLRIAMLHSDTEALDSLIAPDLLFTTHFGQLLSKQDDLQSHRSGVISFRELTPIETHIRVHGSFAVVSVHMQVSGRYAGADFSDALRYTRIWSAHGPNNWRVIGGHISVIQ
jgi:ketosteroid isomerase-like protein